MSQPTNEHDDTTEANTGEKLLGVVKWFDKVKGFGFLHQLGTENDYFVHYSQLQSTEEYVTKYLVAGEYVQFSVSTPGKEAPSRTDGKPSEVAVHVTGIQNGPLMFESHHRHKDRGVVPYPYSKRTRGYRSTTTNGSLPDTPVTSSANPFGVLDST